VLALFCGTGGGIFLRLNRPFVFIYVILAQNF